MEAQILTYQFYPVMKNIYKHLDLKSFITLFNVSKQMRENVTNHFKFNTFNENDWIEFFKIKVTTFNENDWRNFEFNENDLLEFFKIKVTKKGLTEIITIYEIENINDLREFLRKHYTFIDTFKEQLIKIDFILKIIDYTTLSEEFVRKNIEHVNFYKVSRLVKLSEEFIREYKERLDWEMICKYQSLSIDFIKEHKDFVHWAILINCNKIPTKHFYSMMYQFKNEIEESMKMWDLEKELVRKYSEYHCESEDE